MISAFIKYLSISGKIMILSTERRFFSHGEVRNAKKGNKADSLIDEKHQTELKIQNNLTDPFDRDSGKTTD